MIRAQQMGRHDRAIGPINVASEIAAIAAICVNKTLGEGRGLGTDSRRRLPTTAILWIGVALIEAGSFQIASWTAWLAALSSGKYIQTTQEFLLSAPPALVLIGISFLTSALILLFRALQPSPPPHLQSALNFVFFLCVTTCLLSLWWLQARLVDTIVHDQHAYFDPQNISLPVWIWAWLSTFLWCITSSTRHDAWLGLTIITGLSAVFGIFWGAWGMAKSGQEDGWLHAVDSFSWLIVLVAFAGGMTMVATERKRSIRAVSTSRPAVLLFFLGTLVCAASSAFQSDARRVRVWRWMEPFYLESIDAKSMQQVPAADCRQPKEDIVWNVVIKSDALIILGTELTSPDEVRTLQNELESFMTDRGLPLPPFALFASNAVVPPRALLSELLRKPDRAYLAASTTDTLESTVLRRKPTVRGCVCEINSRDILSNEEANWRDLLTRWWRC